MTRYETPEAAYWAFFSTFNDQDADGWAGVMSYPHLRVSALGRTSLYAKAADYSERASWDRIQASGWVRTQGIDPVRTRASATKVHLSGGWTRYDAEDESILTNRVTYIMTNIEGSWGIQARFGVDSLQDGLEGTSADPSAEAATDLVERYLDGWDARALAECASYVHTPAFQVDVGIVRELPDATAYEELLAAQPWSISTQREGPCHSGRPLGRQRQRACDQRPWLPRGPHACGEARSGLGDCRPFGHQAIIDPRSPGTSSATATAAQRIANVATISDVVMMLFEPPLPVGAVHVAGSWWKTKMRTPQRSW